MEAEVDIQEPQLQQEPDPPKKKLWKSLSDKHLYTKSYEDFGKQFSTPESIDKLHKVLTEKELYTKTTDDFKSQFFSDLSPEVKKKVGRVDLEGSSMEAGNALSQSNGVDGGQIPTVEMYNLPNGEMVEADPISLSKKYNELKDRKKEISTGTGSSFTVGTGSTLVDDEEAQKSAKKLREDFKDTDLEGIHEETKDLSEGILANHGKRLMQERNDNPNLYQRDLANLKWRSGFEKTLLNEVDRGGIKPEEYNGIKHDIEMLPVNTGQGEYSNQRLAVQTLANDIRLYGGENKDRLLKNLAIETSKVYGNAYNNKFENAIKDTPESKYLTPEAQLGYQYLKDISPDKAEQYNRLFIDPKSLSDKPDELRGYNHLMQTLEETGIGLKQNAVTEELNSLNNQAKQNGGLSPEQIERATKLEKVNEELSAKRNEMDSKYPDRIDDKVDDAVQEIMGQRTSGLNYAGGKAWLGIKNTAQGVWEAASSPFMSDASNNLRELGIMGETLEENKIYHKTDKNKNVQYDAMVIQPELQKQIDEIKNNSVLTNDAKEQKLYTLLRENTDKFGRVPIKGGKFNINPSSIMYGLTDLGTQLLPFVGLEAVTGGGATAGLARKFVSTFTAAAATTFHDEYANALLEGKPQSEAYKSAMASTAINSLAMAGAGTPTEIRAMASGKTSASKIIAQMSDAEIEKVLANGTPKGLKAFGQSLKDRLKATPQMALEGLKTGAKFEAFMGAANAIQGKEVNFKQSLLGIANFGIMGAGLGHIGYKSPTELQKSAGIEFANKPDEYIEIEKQMRKDGKLNESELTHRIDLIERYKEANNTLPKANAKGEPLSEKEKAEYLYNSVIKNEGNKSKYNLPPKQAEKAEMTALVADHKNDLILEPKTDKQLESTKVKLEAQLEKKDENGKLELTDKERINVKAELEAVNDAIENKSKGEPENISQPIELSTEQSLSKQESGVTPEIKNEEPKVEIPNPKEETGNPVTEPNKIEPKAEEGTGEPPMPPSEAAIEPQAEGNIPERRFTKQMLRSDELSDQSKAEIAKTLNYVRQTHEMTLKEANEVIDKVGLDEAQNMVIGDNNLKPVVRNAVGMTLIKKFNELSEKATDQAEKEYYLDKSIQTASAVTERYGTEAGQSIEIFKLWSQVSPEGQLRAANQDMARQGKEKLRRREKDINAIGNKFKKANEDTVEEIIKNEILKEPSKKEATEKASKAQQKIAKAKQKRSEIIKKYKENKGKNLFSSPTGLTPEGIEFVGNVAKTYIEEGVANLEVLVEKVLAHLEDVAGKKATDEIKKQISQEADRVFNKADISFLKEGLKDKNIKIAEVVKKHYTVVEKVKKTLVQKLMDEADMSQSNAAELAKKVEVAFDRIATRKKRDILYHEKARFDKINNTLNTDKKTEKKTVADDLIKYSNLGAFEGKEFADMVANKFGLGELTKEQAAKLIELANKVQKAPEGSPKNNATEDLLAYRANLKGNDLGETAQAVWYANVLSGYKTHEKNLVSTFFNSMGELSAEMAKDPKSIPYLMAGYLKGVFTRGFVEAAHTIKTGYSPIHIKKIEVPNVLERKNFSGGGINPGNWFKYIMRLMVAEDVLSFQGLKEARAYQLARQEASKNGYSTWSKKGWDKVNSILLHTKERWEQAESQVAEEGIQGKVEKRRRIYELMEESRPTKMTDDSYGFAAHGTFNHESEGALGAITNAVASGLDAINIGSFKPARLIVPFTRIITNVVNNSLDYTPVGLVRAARGVRGFRSFEKNNATKTAFKELSKDERQRLVAKAAIGITVTAALQVMHQAGIIQITGGGTGDNKKDEQLRESGWQEYSIKVGDKYYSYKYTPLVFMTGFLGNMNDAEKYGDDDKKTLTRKMEVASSRIGGQVVDMTWINSASTFLGALAEKNPDTQGAAVSKALAGMTRGFIPYSGAVMQGTQAMNSVFGANKKQADGAWQSLVASMPIAQNSFNDKINALGEPIKVNESTSWVLPDFISTEKDSPEWKLLLDHQGWVAPVNRGTLIVFDQKTQQDRPVTADEYYEFNKKRGAKIKDQLSKLLKSKELIDWNSGNVIKLEKVSPQDFNKWLSKVENEATKDTKAEMFGDAPPKETKDLDINQ